MTDEDHKAAEELAVDMSFYDAIKWLRSVSGRGLRDCGWWAENLALRSPDSQFAKTKPDTVR